MDFLYIKFSTSSLIERIVYAENYFLPAAGAAGAAAGVVAAAAAAGAAVVAGAAAAAGAAVVAAAAGAPAGAAGGAAGAGVAVGGGALPGDGFQRKLHEPLFGFGTTLKLPPFWGAEIVMFHNNSKTKKSFRTQVEDVTCKVGLPQRNSSMVWT